MQFSRFLHNEAVTLAEMAGTAAARTASLGAGRELLVIQDSSNLVFGGRKARARGFGAVGKGGWLSGLMLHVALVSDALTGAVLGPLDIQLFNRKPQKAAPRRQRPTAQKESQRWLDVMQKASSLLAAAASITLVADRESDFYEEFARRPANVHLLTRAAQDRLVRREDGTVLLLSALAGSLTEQGRFTTLLPAAPRRVAREAELILRYARIDLCKPKNGAAADLAKTVPVTLVELNEATAPSEGKALHWRLLTTHAVDTPQQARHIIDLYRKRWLIEEYFHTLKTGGFDIETAQIEDPAAMTRLVAAVACAAVTVMQLLRARDGKSDQKLQEVFEPDERVLLQTISAQYEGKTVRQKNPHPKDSLAYATWVIARLGGWDGYYGKPGPTTLRRGLQDFYLIKYGADLQLPDV